MTDQLYRCVVPDLEDDVECDYQAETPGSVKGHITSVHQGYIGPDFDDEEIPVVDVDEDEPGDGQAEDQAENDSQDEQPENEEDDTVVDPDEYEQQQAGSQAEQQPENDQDDGSPDDQSSGAGSDDQAGQQAGSDGGVGLPLPNVDDTTIYLVIGLLVVLVLLWFYLKNRGDSSGVSRQSDQAETQQAEESTDGGESDEVTLID